VKSSQSLLEVAKILSAKEHIVHRVPVLGEGGNVVNIISQSSLVDFLSKQLGPLVGANDAAIGSLKIASSPVLSVNQNETVINTFRTMDQHKRSGIAITNATGNLVGTTTGKDIRLFLHSPNLSSLHSPIFAHLQVLRSEMNDIRTPTIAIFPTDPLSRAIGLLAATKVHRIYVVESESNYAAVGVISISDILRYLSS